MSRHCVESTVEMGGQTNDQILKGGSPRDIVIQVVGKTGAGKSTFVRAFLTGRDQDQVAIGHTLISCTEQIQPMIIENHSHLNSSSRQKLHGGRLIIADTPGYDDTNATSTDLSNKLGKWLQELQKHKMRLAGVVYLFEISQARLAPEATTRDLSWVQGLLKTPYKSTVLGTTKWEGAHPESAPREEQLKNQHWRKFLEAGSHMYRFSEDISSDHWNAIDSIIATVEEGRRSISAGAARKAEELANMKEPKRQKKWWAMFARLFRFERSG